MIKRPRTEGQSHMIGELFTFALFAMFLLLSLLIVVIGVDVYRGVVDAGESVGVVRTSLGYVAGKVRSDSAMHGVRVEEQDGLTLLVLTEVIDDTPYETYIYHQEGALYECYINADATEFDSEFGDRLTEIDSFNAVMESENLLALTATASDGRSQTLHLACRAGQEGTP